MREYLPDRQYTGCTMHELSLATSVRDIVENAARENNAVTVKEVNLVVGDFSSVAVDSLQFAMDIVKKGSVFENAKINIRSAKAVLLCSECNSESDMADYILKCGKCGSGAVKVISGDRMYVESIDVE